MPSPFPWSPVIRECSCKKTQIEKKIISEAVNIYHKGDENIPPQRANTFFTDRAKSTKHPKLSIALKAKEDVTLFFSIKLT